MENKKLKKFIIDFNINRAAIAEAIGINKNTFKNKFSDNNTMQVFTEEEEKKIITYLRKMNINLIAALPVKNQK